jgi:hypothetical protein
MEKFGHSFDKLSSIGDSAKTIMHTPEIYGIMITNSISPMQRHFELEYLHFSGYKYGLDSHSLKRIRPSFDFDLTYKFLVVWKHYVSY